MTWFPTSQLLQPTVYDKLKDIFKIKVVSWPTPQDYNEAVQNPASSFADPELQNGKPELTPLGLPKPVSGMFASVYRMQCGAEDWAARCFLFNFPDQRERYERIEGHLRSERLPYMLGFDHQEDGLTIRGDHYPFLKMEWCDGVNLNTYIDGNLSDKDKLSKLAEDFKSMTIDLRNHDIAHGDLQHGNIMVVDDQLKLVDYDGMYVPALSGFTSNELGHRNYQHPGRTTEYFGPNLDNFSAWVIYLTLKCLSLDPGLWRQLRGGDECLLLRQADFAEPLISHSFHALETHANVTIRAMSKLIRYLLTLPVEQVPAIDQQVYLPSDLPEVNPDSRLPDWMKDRDELLERARRQPPTIESKSKRGKKKKRGTKQQLKQLKQSAQNTTQPSQPISRFSPQQRQWALNAIYNKQSPAQQIEEAEGSKLDRKQVGTAAFLLSLFMLLVAAAVAPTSSPVLIALSLPLMLYGLILSTRP